MLPVHVTTAFVTAPGGLLTTGDLRKLGVQRLTAAAWAREHLTVRLLHGVYRDAGVSASPEECLHLPIRYLGQRARKDVRDVAITGVGALAAHGIDGFSLPCVPTVLVDASRHPRQTPWAFSPIRASLQGDDVQWHRGIPLARPERAVADAASNPHVSDADVRAAMDVFRNREQLTVPNAVAYWRDMAGTGARRLLGLERDGQFEQESEGERRAFAALFLEHPPVPDCQVVLVGQLRVDFVFLSAALVVEYLGKPHDGRADRDSTRAYALERLGYRIVFVSKSMLRDPELPAHIHTLRIHREQQIRSGQLCRPELPRQPPRRQPLRTLAPLVADRAA